MITKLSLENFKSIGQQVYDFTNFDLLVGANNSGKSTILQALAIWQFCVDEFRRSKRSGNKGIQVVLPNFTPLPLPEFNLLWKDKTDRHWPLVGGKKKQQYILIKILLEWQRKNGASGSFGLHLRYQSRQTIYAIPIGGWAKFRDCTAREDPPVIAYVPPFSGLEPEERWLDDAPMHQQVGKGQPGGVLRNLLLRVQSSDDGMQDWEELASAVERWFSVKLQKPKYEKDRDVFIDVEYKQDRKKYDIIAGGSGFHQALTLLAFLYGYNPTTILLDEPDAHLHVKLQREILDFFKEKSRERKTQFLIATHAEEFVRGVDAGQIVSLLGQKPQRIESTPPILRAMSDVSNEEIMRTKTSPYIVYVEGESDERILRAWAGKCSIQDSLDKICFKSMNGGNKQNMKELADRHFEALKEIVSNVKRLMLFDYDSQETAFHPKPNNPTLFEWGRKNIENYLLIPDAWKRAALKFANSDDGDLFSIPILKVIDEFFLGENLTLPPGRTWQNVDANVFKVVDGKRLLFVDERSLFHQLQDCTPSIQLPRESVAGFMTKDEMHQDILNFLEKMKNFTSS